jgi:ubiquinone/menaquinone biosynthesis C-methylase UbiE
MKNHKAILGKISGGHVLDVATGRGHSIITLMKNLNSFTEFTAVDMVDYTAESEDDILKHAEVTYFQMDAQSMDFADNKFDTVHISHSLHHLTDVHRVLNEMVRVLKPDGHLIVDEMYRDNQTVKQLTVVYLHDWWADIDTSLGINHNHTYHHREIISMFDQLDLKDTWFEEIINDEYTESELIQIGERGIDQYYQRAQDLSNFDDFKETGEQLRQRLHNVGAQLATTLLIVGKK